MRYPVLLAGTPRAGRWNHRVLIPPGFEPVSMAAVALVDAARESPEGANYLSCRRSVRQPATGREGLEILVLAGVDVARLEQRRLRPSVHAALQHCLKKLGSAVAQKEDWELKGESLVVIFPELTSWMSEDRSFQQLPCHPTLDRPLQRPQDCSHRRSRFLVSTLMLLVSIGVAVVATGLFPWNSHPSENGPATDTDQKKADRNLKRSSLVDFKQQYTRMLQDLRLKDEEAVRRGLWYAARGEWPTTAVMQQKLCEQDEMRDVLKKWAGVQSFDPLAFLPKDSDDHNLLSPLLPEGKKRDLEELLRLRRGIQELRVALEELHREAQCVVVRTDHPVYLTLALTVGNAKYADLHKLRLDEKEVLLPFLDRRDSKVLGLARHFLESEEMMRVWRNLNLEALGPAEWPNPLNHLSGNLTRLMEQLKLERSERRTQVERIPLKRLVAMLRKLAELSAAEFRPQGPPQDGGAARDGSR